MRNFEKRLIWGRWADLYRRVGSAALGLAMAFAAAQPSSAQKLAVGYTQSGEYAALYSAAEEGFFKAKGLDVDLQLIALNSTIPPALQSGSIQIGGPTVTTFIQAVDGGLDLAAVAGGSVMVKGSKNYAVLARHESKIEQPADFAGKRVGVPGIGAFMHVVFRKWLSLKGVDSRSVTFVEVPFPQMADVMRGGTVDAVLAIEPVMTRVMAGGNVRVVSTFVDDLPNELMVFLYATTRGFAKEHPATLEKFRVALREGEEFVKKNPDRAREHVTKYTKLPLPLLQGIALAVSRPDLPPKMIDDWLDLMRDQKMLRTKLDGTNLYVK